MGEDPKQDVTERLTDAHRTLAQLRQRIDDLEHRARIDDAIRHIEAALNLLAVNTGGLL